MIVTLKTLQQQTFKIEIEGEENVKALKEKIEKEKGPDTFPAGGQKLIYAGKILDDEKPLSTYKIEEKNFVVVMVTKPKPATPASTPAPAVSEATATPPASAPPIQATPVSEEKPKQEETTQQQAEKPASQTTSTTSTESGTTSASESESATTTATESSMSATSVTSDGSASSAESALVTGQAYEDVVSQMVNMGFPRDQVQRAMRASFNNPDRAVEYLFNGIPDMPREEPPQPVPPPAAAGQGQSEGQGQTQGQSGGTPASSPGGGSTPASSGTGSGTGGTGVLAGPPAGSRPVGEDALAFLRNQPQFQHMRTLIQQNPQLLPELLQQIGRSNPQLLQMISENQEQFISMLNEQGSDSAAQGGGGSGGRSAAPGELGQDYIQVTQQEKEAIERLKALGFSEGMCIQAYFACERNEELAANYLLSHGFDDEDS